jgi:hypothetical protein
MSHNNNINTVAINLPVEILREIFSHLLLQHQQQKAICKYKGSNNKCQCWQLDLLSISMVCKSWSSIAFEYMMYHSNNQEGWLPLLNFYGGNQRSFPFRSRLVKLLAESKLSNLSLHNSVRHLVIDFASFDTIRREKTKNNTIVKRKGKYYYYYISHIN